MRTKKTNPSVDAIPGKAAALEVNGVPVAHGRVSFYPNPDRGRFWPDGAVRLETPPVEGTLALAGSSMRVRIQNLQLSDEGPGLWSFTIAVRRQP